MSEEIEEIQEDVQGETDLMQELSEAWEASEASEVEEAPEAEEAPAVEATTEEQAELPLEESEPAEPVEAKADEVPKSMSAAAREKWKDTPEEVKAEFARLDQRMEGLAQKYGRDAQRARQMDKTLSPYNQLFAMNGGPQNTLPGLLQTAAVLQMGSAPQKAQQVAALIKQFGVDIKTLDSMLVGEAPPAEVQQQTQMEQMLQQRLNPLQQQLQQYQQREQKMVQQEQHQIGTEIQHFAAQNEFYNDVKAEMADILDLSANRGREISLQEAYDKACQLNPQIASIIKARSSQQTVQSKRKAGSSIHGSPAGGTAGAAPNSMRSAIEMAWEGVGRA